MWLGDKVIHGTVVSLSLSSCALGSHVCEQPWGEVHVWRNWSLLPRAVWVNLEVNPSAQRLSPGWQLDCRKPWGRTTQLSAPRFLTFRNCAIINSPGFKLLDVEVICYVTIDKEYTDQIQNDKGGRVYRQKCHFQGRTGETFLKYNYIYLKSKEKNDTQLWFLFFSF